MSSDYIEPMVTDENGNIYFSAKYLSDNKNKEIEFLHSIIKKARAKLEVMFDNGDENTVLDDLLELDKILEINKED